MMKIHPDVWAAHAQFGGDLETMQRCYEWYDLKSEIESLRSRAEKAEAENAELKKALDSIEIEHGLTSNGNLWRFWSAKAKGVAAKYVILNATCEKLAAALDQAQRALASMIDPSCIAQTTVIYAFATATTAEATARHVLASYRKEVPDANG